MKVSTVLVVLILMTSLSLAAESSTTKPITQVIKLKATIVGAKEQPRFLSIVPWKKLASPVVYAPTTSDVLFNKLTPTSPQQLAKKRHLLQHLQGRNVKSK